MKIIIAQEDLTIWITDKTTKYQYQVVIAHWLTQRPATGEVLGSNPCKGEND